MKRKTAAAVFLVLFSIIGSRHTAWAGIADAGGYLLNNVVSKRLPNGITVLLLNRGYAPVLSFQISFRVGSVDEDVRTIGAAHMLEHMLFKGTDRIGTKDFKAERPLQARIEVIGETIDRLKLLNPKNERIPVLEKELRVLQEQQSHLIEGSPYDRLYSEEGGVGFNASTSKDMTGYYVSLPASKLAMWAEIESERLRNPVFREYYQERNNVLQERLMRYDAVGSGILYERFLATAFIAHPYRHPIIGWRSNIPFLSVEEVKRFYYEYYIPSRMTIVIVGRQNTDETFRVLERYFGTLPARPEPAPIAIQEPQRPGERRIEVLFEAGPELIVGWNKPAFPSRDDCVLDVAGEILAGGKASRLYRSLVVEKQIATSVSVWSATPGSRYDNCFALFVKPRPPHTPEDCEAAIDKEMDRFFEDVSDDEIRNIAIAMESEMVFGLESNTGIARLLSHYQTVHGDWRYAARYPSLIRTVTRDEIRSLKDKYFRPDNRTVALLRDSRAMEKKR